ncbi:hypothetical protein MTBBW1_2400030 [Desulfamplus magnetovallimortis]|uniref:Uncharacterized protein n=1 Tax=Desulfamplus magnetovallimortis TaxID=1246637 RepID=A0A1W1HEB2_9BACT|nr:hypothetical protein [Desulfamplus magnetovallimortis]SLM30776.1 hypothetical protein MTBBW1_2400030 [Desulfamplus magnetovallimortis]
MYKLEYKNSSEYESLLLECLEAFNRIPDQRIHDDIRKTTYALASRIERFSKCLKDPITTVKIIEKNLSSIKIPLEKYEEMKAIIAFGIIDIATRDEYLAKKILEIHNITKCIYIS